MEKRITITMESTKETKNICLRESMNGIYITAIGGNNTSFIIPKYIVSKFIQMISNFQLDSTNNTLEFEVEADREYGAGVKNINLKIILDFDINTECLTVGVKDKIGWINAYTIEKDQSIQIYNLAKRAEMMGKL